MSSDNPTCQKLVHTTAEGGMCICLHDQGTLHQIEGRPLIPKSVFVESLPKLDDGGKGPAEAAGIKIGDRIVSVQVGSLPVTLVTSTNDVVKAMKSVTGSISVTMNVERDPNCLQMRKNSYFQCLKSLDVTNRIVCYKKN